MKTKLITLLLSLTLTLSSCCSVAEKSFETGFASTAYADNVVSGVTVTFNKNPVKGSLYLVAATPVLIGSTVVSIGAFSIAIPSAMLCPKF